MGPKSLLFTLCKQLPCPAGLVTVAGNLVGSAKRVRLWFGRACGEAASLQGRACPSDWLWMTLCCAAVQPRDNSCRCKPRASHGSSLTHCTAGTGTHRAAASVRAACRHCRHSAPSSCSAPQGTPAQSCCGSCKVETPALPALPAPSPPPVSSCPLANCPSIPRSVSQPCPSLT